MSVKLAHADSKPATPSRPKPVFVQEDPVEITALIDDCCRSGVSRNALLLAARRLPNHLSRAHHLRLAIEALDPLTSAERARTFDLPDGSRAIVWRGDAGPLLGLALYNLRHLFVDDASSPDISSLIRVFALPRDADTLRGEVRAAQQATMPVLQPTTGATEQPSEPISPTALQTLEQSLVQVNVSHFARHRRIWRMAPDGRLEPAWDKRFLAVADLTRTLLPEYDATADPWLYRRLTRTLDRRLLALLAAPAELRAAGPFSLDLNVGSLISSDFLRFDAALPSHLRGNLVIDLSAIDILADPACYLFARAFVRARRYQVMIRDLSVPLLQALDFSKLDPDLAEINYGPELTAQPGLLPKGMELMLAYHNTSGQLDRAARSFADEQGIKLLSPRD